MSEQCGVASSDMFQLVNNHKMVVTNSSGLGLDMGAVSVAAIGQADDVALLSPHPLALQSLLNLSEDFSSATSLQNVPEKTKLLVYSPRGDTTSATYWQEAAPITMAGAPLPLSSQAEHVGVLRSTGACGNMPAILSRLSSHSKSLYTILSCGMARHHRGNPAASLRVESLYCSPASTPASPPCSSARPRPPPSLPSRRRRWSSSSASTPAPQLLLSTSSLAPSLLLASCICGS